MSAAVNFKKDRALAGIWLAIRKTAESGPVLCSQCFAEVREYQTYAERMWGEPNVICSTCIENMVEAKLALIKAGG